MSKKPYKVFSNAMIATVIATSAVVPTSIIAGDPIHVDAFYSTNIKGTDIITGHNFNMVLKEDGTVWAWGTNENYRLGNGTNVNSMVPVKVLGLSNIVKIFNDGAHSFALDSEGSIFAWGNNGNGQLGLGDSSIRVKPEKVEIADVENIIPGYNNTFFIKTDGSVWVVGYNGGKFGDGTYNSSNVPIKINGLTDVKDIYGGINHTIALKNDGSLWSWGRNLEGQLGDGTTTTSLVPKKITGISDVKEISGGSTFSNAITKEGKVYTWGSNSAKQLGLGAISGVNVPTEVSLPGKAKSISSVDTNTYVLLEDGTAYSWGGNPSGNLGNSSFTDSNIPVKISNLTDVVYLGNRLAVKSDNTVWAWGNNMFGHIGNENTYNSSTPAKINGLTVNIPVIDNTPSNLELAIEGVELAESTRGQSDIDSARILVDAVTDVIKKGELNERLDIVQSSINLENEAALAVENAENLKTLESVESAKLIIDSLPEGILKEELNERLDIVKSILDLENDAVYSVENAENLKTLEYVESARLIVDSLPESVLKDELNARLDVVKNDINEEEDGGEIESPGNGTGNGTGGDTVIINPYSDIHDVTITGLTKIRNIPVTTLFNNLDLLTTTYEVINTDPDIVSAEFDINTGILKLTSNDFGYGSVTVKGIDGQGNKATQLFLIDVIEKANYGQNSISDATIKVGQEMYKVPLGEVFGEVVQAENVKYTVMAEKIEEDISEVAMFNTRMAVASLTNDYMFNNSIDNSLNMFSVANINDISTMSVIDVPEGVTDKNLFEDDNILVRLVNSRMIVEGKKGSSYNITVQAESEKGVSAPISFKLDVKDPDSNGTGPETNPGTDTGTNPGTDTGTNPGTDTGTNPGNGTGTNPGNGTGTNPGNGTGTNPGNGTGTNPGNGTGVEKPNDNDSTLESNIYIDLELFSNKVKKGSELPISFKIKSNKDLKDSKILLSAYYSNENYKDAKELLELGISDIESGDFKINKDFIFNKAGIVKLQFTFINDSKEITTKWIELTVTDDKLSIPNTTLPNESRLAVATAKANENSNVYKKNADGDFVKHGVLKNKKIAFVLDTEGSYYKLVDGTYIDSKDKVSIHIAQVEIRGNGIKLYDKNGKVVRALKNGEKYKVYSHDNNKIYVGAGMYIKKENNVVLVNGEVKIIKNITLLKADGSVEKTLKKGSKYKMYNADKNFVYLGGGFKIKNDQSTFKFDKK